MARVFMDSLDTAAYQACFTAIFSAVSDLHSSFRIGESLCGILMDWSDAQLAGLEGAIGSEATEKIAKGCQVCSVKCCLLGFLCNRTRFVYGCLVMFTTRMHTTHAGSFHEICEENHTESEQVSTWAASIYHAGVWNFGCRE